MKYNNFFERIFSLKNKDNHKVLTIMGIRFKFRKRPLSSLNAVLLEEINSKKNNNGLIFYLDKDFINNFFDRLTQEIKKEEGYIDCLFSPAYAFKKKAFDETIEFIENNMDLTKIIMKRNRMEHLNFVLSKVSQDGLFLEFGVWSGKTINCTAKRFSNKTIYGFDSFEGLPEDWDGWCVDTETFKKTELPQVENNVKLVKGWFNETLPTFLNEHKEKIAFLHVDCDIYSSASYVLKELVHRFQKGTIILFDEFFNLPNWKNHEYKAFMEIVQKYNFEYEYISFGYNQVAVIITKIK